jgi:hypothetical protein
MVELTSNFLSTIDILLESRFFADLIRVSEFGADIDLPVTLKLAVVE